MASRPLPERRGVARARCAWQLRHLSCAHVCDIDVDVGPIRDLGPMPHGRRRIIQIPGGTVRGPRLEAEIVPGGADWQYVRSDGVLELVARYSILTRDGVEIAITNRGLRRASPEIMDGHVARRCRRSGAGLLPHRAGVRGTRRTLRLGSTTASSWRRPRGYRIKCRSRCSRWCSSAGQSNCVGSSLRSIQQLPRRSST